ncbi:hypothetical protein LEP1GSC133_1543 [Leptospira borgpetersenii serovar Pomona str. 200901868]|uniref:Uncharacterized protein n=3 Tax=Leptospira TaxID=171 RepID=A0AA87T071_9LEPT|nr:hypothetical protein DQM68_04565 [Leptospira mayottensis]AZQ03492.1 hypothetical protein LEP1GSC190_17180 [Leptospira mayottensis 200901116]EKS01913.1 hypothetical protein LEP1GSC125_3419 [Leptospira mayottensis 200901122]EMO65190.1 hypothetical protein LEP1GSC133_1543 [Leptospira borgpetersenii serovar Pomona str. 200901868]AXR63661.1 hypothetical protein DQM28_04910 [Leptospira mayottensis]
MVIYGFSNGFYRWNILVGVPTSEVLVQVLMRMDSSVVAYFENLESMKNIPEHFPIQVLDRKKGMTDNALGISLIKRL